PQHGLLLPGAFMTGAKEGDLIKLSEMALTNALKASANFSKIGIHLRVAINVPMEALVKLQVPEIVRSQRPGNENWPGLIIDVPEEQVINELSAALDLQKEFEPSNVPLPIETF